MKAKIWFFQIPIVVLFTWAFWITESGIGGNLNSSWLREKAYPFLQEVAGQLTNLKFLIRGPQAPKNKIVIVEIDGDSLEKYGRWPWHRDLTANLVQSVFDAGAKSVGLDIMFPEPDQRVSPALAQFLKEKKLDSSADSFETDHVLESVIAFNSDHLCLGWASEDYCQPAFSSAESCPIDDPAYVSSIPKEMPKFALKNVTFKKPFVGAESRLLNIPSFIANIPIYDQAAAHSGFISAIPDRDGYIRRAPLVLLSQGNVYTSLPLEMAKMVLGEEIQASFDERGKIEKLAFAKSGREIPVSPLGMMEVNFRGPTASFQYVKASEVLSNDDQIRIEVSRKIASVSKKEILKDATVLIGISAVGVFDMRAFPFDSNTPGVEGHANILDNLLSGDMLKDSTGPGGTLILYLLMSIGALIFAFTVEKLESIPALLVFLAVMGGGFVVDQKVFFEKGINWNTSLLCIELFLIFVLTLAVKYVLEEKNKKFIRGAFSKYVSPSIIDSIMKDPSKLTVGGEKKDLTVLFSDIRGFTTFSEKMDAKQLSVFLNEYLGKMTDIIFDTQGTLDKYIGDAVMAFWGAPLDQPNHAVNAVSAAIAMQKLLGSERARFREKFGIEVHIGIGINSGAVSVGNMGSERIFEYTVIGDHVNLASRVEGLTKTYHADILTTRHTFDSIQAAGQPIPAHRVLDEVKVKGKNQGVEMIEILTRDLPPEGIQAFEKARARYKKQDWDEAIASFQTAARLLGHDGNPDQISLDYIERCNEFKKNPPSADWDGVWVMTSK